MLLIIHYSDYQCRSCWQQNVHKKYCFNDGRTLCTQKSCTKHWGENVTEVNLFFPPKYRSRRIWNYFYLLLYIIHLFFLSLKTYFQTISKSKDLKCSITVLKKQSHNTTDMTRLLHLNAGRNRSKREAWVLNFQGGTATRRRAFVFGIVVAFVVVVWKKLFYKRYFQLRLIWYLYMFG